MGDIKYEIVKHIGVLSKAGSGGVFEGNPAPGTAQGALKEKLPTLLRHTRFHDPPPEYGFILYPDSLRYRG